jgi:DNA helicase-2/ATP-dependent DNA helicase PcrA
MPSRFINEIPSNTLQIINQVNNCYNGGGKNYGNGGYGNNKFHKKAAFSTKPSYQSYKPEEDDDYGYEPDEYADYDAAQSSRTSSLIGVRVYHESFGYGKIVAVYGQSCEVDFEKYGRKKIMGTYLRRA